MKLRYKTKNDITVITRSAETGEAAYESYVTSIVNYDGTTETLEFYRTLIKAAQGHRKWTELFS